MTPSLCSGWDVPFVPQDEIKHGLQLYFGLKPVESECFVLELSSDPLKAEKADSSANTAFGMTMWLRRYGPP
jgi:hypothetical protein